MKHEMIISMTSISKVRFLGSNSYILVLKRFFSETLNVDKEQKTNEMTWATRAIVVYLLLDK